MWAELALVIGGYFLGSVPFIYALGKSQGVDLCYEGDRHVGGTHLFESVGRFVGVIGTLLDTAKGVIIAFVARGLNFDPWWVGLAAVALLAGQMWPIFLKFNGGRGNTVALGAAVVLIPKETIISLVSPLVGLVLSGFALLFAPNVSLKERGGFKRPHQGRGIPLGLLGTFFLLPLLCWVFAKPIGITLAFAVIFILILIRRLTANLRQDLSRAPNKGKVLLNRFLYDRSYR